MRLVLGRSLLSALAAVAALVAAGLPTAGPTRIVAVGDVHGAYTEFISILQKTHLVDGNAQWAGGASVLVQTGDLLDRGPGSRKSMDLLMDLGRQAKSQGGEVIPLLGNHEVLVMIGDLRYVAPEDYRSFATSDSERLREQAYGDYQRFTAAHRAHHHPGLGDDAAYRNRWFEEHPPGFFEFRDAFGPQGRYGSWLRTHHALVVLGDVLFVHGGLNPKLPRQDPAELDRRILGELARFDSLWQALSDQGVIWRYMTMEEAIHHLQEEWAAMQIVGRVDNTEAARDLQELLGLQSWLILSPDGPLWYRGLALEPEASLKSDLEAMLAQLNLHYLVAGHTVRPKYQIMARFENRVFLIDTGMLREAYGGRASALEIQSDRFTAYYADGEPTVLSQPSDVPAGDRSPSGVE